MKVLTIGDLHFSTNNVIEMDIISDKIIRKVKEINPEFTVLLGDTLDRFAIFHTTPYNRANKFLEKLVDITKVYLLIGNHDIKTNDEFLSDEHPFNPHKLWRNIKIIDKPYLEEIKEFTFSFVPYVPKGRFMEALDFIPNWNKSKCIFAHQEFKGSCMNNLVSLNGDEWKKEYPLCVSGHIHNYSEISENMIYVGTPLQHKFDESINKTISLFDFSSVKFSHQRISLNPPLKIESKVTIDTIKDFNLDFNHMNKVNLCGTLGEVKSMLKHPNVIKWRRNKVKIGQIIKQENIKNEDYNNELVDLITKKSFIETFKFKLSNNNKKLYDYFITEFGDFQ